MAGPGHGDDATLGLVNLPALMARTSGAPEIAIGLIDGPVTLDHPDLAGAAIRPLSGKGSVPGPRNVAGSP